MTDKSDEILQIIESELKILIQSESLKPGDKLPNIDQLVSILNVSRSHLRHALLTLEDQGLLNIKQGKGILLRHDDFKALDDKPSINAVKLKYFAETRIAVESETAYLASMNGTEAEIEELYAALKCLEEKQAPSKKNQYLEADHRFHYLIARMAGNPILLELLKYVNKQLEPGRQMTLAFPKGAEKSFRGHLSIYEAIKRRDHEDARQQMRLHLLEVCAPQTSIAILKSKSEMDKADLFIDDFLATLNQL